MWELARILIRCTNNHGPPIGLRSLLVAPSVLHNNRLRDVGGFNKLFIDCNSLIMFNLTKFTFSILNLHCILAALVSQTICYWCRFLLPFCSSNLIWVTIRLNLKIWYFQFQCQRSFHLPGGSQQFATRCTTRPALPTLCLDQLNSLLQIQW